MMALIWRCPPVPRAVLGASGGGMRAKLCAEYDQAPGTRRVILAPFCTWAEALQAP